MTKALSRLGTTRRCLRTSRNMSLLFAGVLAALIALGSGAHAQDKKLLPLKVGTLKQSSR